MKLPFRLQIAAKEGFPVSATPKRIVFAILFAAFAALLVFVLPKAFGSTEADPAATEHRFDGGSIMWTVSEYPALVRRDNPIRLELAAESGEPLGGARLSVTMEMIGMLCGEYRFLLAETSPGIYTGSGIPLMPGIWRASLELELKDGSRHIVERTIKAVY